MTNPFQFGRELGADELVDRDDEIVEVMATIRQGGKLFLVGPRRYGKTSILKAAEDRLVAEGAVVLRYDAESYPSLDSLVTALVAGAAKGLKGGVERTGEHIHEFFAKLRPEASFSITDREWRVRLGVATTENEGKHVELLVDALDGLERLAKAQPENRPVGLVIDEFQKVIDVAGRTAEAQIRAAIQRHKRTGYVLAGSKTRLLTAMTMDAARPFYRLGKLRFIGPVPRADFREFLRSRLAESGFSVPGKEGEEALDLILRAAEEVPYNVQVLAHGCWDQLRAGKIARERVLSRGVVEQSFERIVRQYDPFYTQLWNSLTAIQQKTLMAVISEQGRNLQSMRVVRVLGKGPSTVRRSLEALMGRDILREEKQQGSVRMRFEDPFFAQWIREFTTNL
jgi:AAA+ ATPase superfamily predicted ATPase